MSRALIVSSLLMSFGASASMFRSQGLVVASLPDPSCHTGTLSLAGNPKTMPPGVTVMTKKTFDISPNARCKGNPLEIAGKKSFVLGKSWGALGNAEIISEEECNQACLSEPTCNFAVWRTSGQCSAFHSCSDPKVDLYKSGQKEGQERKFHVWEKKKPAEDGTTKAAAPQVCCAGYCGECSDYPTCKSVRGQDSENACCASKVLEMSCLAGAPANVCLKSCTESVPPCIMPKGEVFEMPETTSAAEDCGNAVDDWMKEAQSAVEGAKDGKDQWASLKDKGIALMKKRLLVKKHNQTRPCPSRKT